MAQQVKVIYENGVLRPLEPVHLAEGEQASVSILNGLEQSALKTDDAFMEYIRAEVAQAKYIPSLEEVRESLRGVSSLSATVIAERGEY